MVSTMKTTNGSVKIIPIKLNPTRNRNRLLATAANLLHGSATAAWSSATQCRNMNFPRLFNHNNSSQSPIPKISSRIATGRIQPRLSNT